MRAFAPFLTPAFAPALALVLGCSDAPQAPVLAPHPAAATPDFSPTAFGRLTTRQYRNTVADLLGDVGEPTLPADTTPYLFESIGATSEPLSESGVQLYEEHAAQATALVFAEGGRRDMLVGCRPSAVTDPCALDFIGRFGRLAYRRPLTGTEEARWLAVAAEAGSTEPWLGLRSVVAGMLQSPWVVYRTDVGHPDPADPSLYRLDDHELAARLAFVLWNTTPDAALLDAADAGRLSTPAGLAAEVDRLLDDPRVRQATEVFFEQYLDLPRFDRAAPDPATYPGWNPALHAAMRAETLLLVDDLIYRRDQDVRQLFSARRAFVNDILAAHYGLDVPGTSPITFVPVDLPPDSERAGLLGLGAFLVMNAHAVDTSPTLRGKYVVERVLCVTVPAPPGDIELDLSGTEEEVTTLRERLEQHRDDPACSGCHTLMDPTGFLFENFDATGAWRETDNGEPIDASGALDGVGLAGSGDLADVLAEHPRVGPCMAKQLFRHAHGRLDTHADVVTLDQISSEFAAAGHRFRALQRALVLHESFRVVAAPEDGEDP
jgi:hypothetical protein